MSIRKIIHSVIISKLPRRCQFFIERFYYYYFVKNYVENEVCIIRKYCDGRKHSLDIGANRGQLTLFLSRASSHVYCFEPVPWLSIYLKQRFQGLNVTIEECALGSVNDELYLQIPSIGNEVFETRSSLLNDFHDDRIHGKKVTKVEKVKVKVRRLDDLHIENIGFIKMDVEGYELEVLEGGRNTIKRCRPNMLIEIEQRHHGEKDVRDIFCQVLDMGYTGYFMHNKKLVDIERFDARTMQNPVNEKSGDYVSNFLFLKT